MVFKTRVGITFYITLIFILVIILFIVSLVFLSDSIWAKWLCGSVSLLLAAVFVFHLIPMIIIVNFNQQRLIMGKARTLRMPHFIFEKLKLRFTVFETIICLTCIQRQCLNSSITTIYILYNI